jgi:hypothetical protein
MTDLTVFKNNCKENAGEKIMSVAVAVSYSELHLLVLMFHFSGNILKTNP